MYHRLYVIHNTSCICWKHCRMNCSFGCCINQLSLGTLWIFCLKNLYLHTRLVFNQCLYFLYAIHLIIFYCENTSCIIKQFQNHSHSIYQVFRTFYHSAIVRGNIWFTFCAVCDYIINLIRFLR